MATIRREVWRDGVLVSVDTVEMPDDVMNEQTLHGRLADAIADLRPVAAGSGGMTAAQLTPVVRGMARILLALVRLYLRRTEDVD